ncbi:MAG: alpha/beta hydrolase [Verrucomicrobiales bacterium]
MKWKRSIAGTLAVLCGTLLTGGVSHAAVDGENASGKIYKTEVPASEEPLVARSNYKIWIPEGTPLLRSIFAINMRAAGEHLFYRDTEWRSLAARTRSAIMFCEFEAEGVRGNGYGSSMLKACNQFATELSRPELRHAPLVLWGHSMGGRVAQDFVRFSPSRVLAIHIALRKLPSSKEFMGEEAAPMKVPALYLMGEKDSKPDDIRVHFMRSRSNGSPRAWIRLPGQGHWPKGMSFGKDDTTTEDWRSWAANDVVIPWTEAVIQLRLPESLDSETEPVELRELRIEDGWLGDVETGRIASYTRFKGEKSTASWFPNEEVAKAWTGFSFPERSLEEDD